MDYLFRVPPTGDPSWTQAVIPDLPSAPAHQSTVKKYELNVPANAGALTWAEATGGGGGGGDFDIHDDVATSGTIATNDRIIFSAEDAQGDPMRYTTFANFKTALNIPIPALFRFDIHDHVTNSATIADDDRIVFFSDENVLGDPNRYTTFADFRTALGSLFDINSDVTTYATPGDSDRFVFVDISESGNPMRIVTFANLRTALGGSFDIHDNVTTSGSIADADRIIFSDESASGDPMKYTTFKDFKAKVSFDIYDDVTRTPGIADDDRIVFADKSDSLKRNSYITFANFKSALNIPASAQGLDIHEDITNSASISPNDRSIFADEDYQWAAAQPLRARLLPATAPSASRPSAQGLKTATRTSPVGDRTLGHGLAPIHFCRCFCDRRTSSV